MAKAKPVHEFCEPFPEKQTQAHLQLLHANIYLGKLQLPYSPPVVYIHLEFNYPNENSSCREHCPFSWGHKAHAWENIFSRQFYSSVSEHKLLQSNLPLQQCVVFSHELQRDAGLGYPASVVWLPSHLSLLEDQFLIQGQLNGSMSFRVNAPCATAHAALNWTLLQNIASVSRCKSIQETSTLDTTNPEKQRASI